MFQIDNGNLKFKYLFHNNKTKSLTQWLTYFRCTETRITYGKNIHLKHVVWDATSSYPIHRNIIKTARRDEKYTTIERAIGTILEGSKLRIQVNLKPSIAHFTYCRQVGASIMIEHVDPPAKCVFSNPSANQTKEDRDFALFKNQ